MEAVASFDDEASAVRGAVERAAEAFDAEIGVVLRDGEVVASVGFGLHHRPGAELVRVAAGQASTLELQGLGTYSMLVVPVEDEIPGHLLVGRRDDRFDREDEALLRAMGRAMTMACKLLRIVDSERSLRATSEAQTAEIEALLSSLVERQRLLERLSRIQASISHRKPLQDVLQAITHGAGELLDSEVVGLRLIDPDDPNYMVTLAAAGVSDEDLEAIRRIPLGSGAGGRAVAEDRLVVMEDYEKDPAAIGVFSKRNLQTAMAAPVHENGEPIGSLVVASYKPKRRYSDEEKAALIAFAEHASLALTDAKTVEAMREAQRSKDMFLAMVSHELKTPLTVIMGTLRTLERFLDTIDRDEQKSMLAVAFERGKDLKKLIDRLLQGASAELVDMEADAFLPDLITEAVRGFEHSFRLNVHEIPELTLQLNPAAIHRVLGILIENALSHSPPSTTIDVGAHAMGSDVCFWVENAGSIPADDHESIFLPFQRGAEAQSSGVGLGLYIAKRVAQSMGGSVTVLSIQGRVRFTLALPTSRTAYTSLGQPTHEGNPQFH